MAPHSSSNGSSTPDTSLTPEQRYEWTLHPPKDGSYKPTDPSLSLRTDDVSRPPPEQSLSDFRKSEGHVNRQARLKSLFEGLSPSGTPPATNGEGLSAHEAEKRRKRLEARQAYATELWLDCGGKKGDLHKRPEWKQFERFVESKEEELWRVFHDIDRDGDGRLDSLELRNAFGRAGVDVPTETVNAFLTAVDKNRDGMISFAEWRDFLLLLPRPADLPEIFRFYTSRPLTRIATSVLTPDGDVTMGASGSGWARGKRGLANELHVGVANSSTVPGGPQVIDLREEKMNLREDDGLSEKANGKRKADSLTESGQHGDGDDDEEEEGSNHPFEGAGKFLLAGGIAGAVSRTATAPFDRLKVYLINEVAEPSARSKAAASSKPSASNPSPAQMAASVFKNVKPTNPIEVTKATTEATKVGTRALYRAMGSIYAEGGAKSFFVGNGLNIVKIFPESATKFLTYELSKRAFAKYVDKVDDQSKISGASRFVSGGVGGVVSQFAIYPVETLKTRVMSSTSGSLKGNALLLDTASGMWRHGGVRTYYRGLIAALVGVFPYSAIDMSTFDALKQAYIKAFGTEPGVLGTLAFGAFSGGIGATSVYPLNLVRTRLQSQGSPSHPQVYTGIRDCATKTYHNEGIRGLYKGLTPSLMKVVPAVSISWVVYDYTTKVLQVGHD